VGAGYPSSCSIKAQDPPGRDQPGDPRKAQIIEMRFFGGLTVEEIGEVLKVSTGRIKRDWRAAKAWLYQELTR